MKAAASLGLNLTMLQMLHVQPEAKLRTPTGKVTKHTWPQKLTQKYAHANHKKLTPPMNRYDTHMGRQLLAAKSQFQSPHYHQYHHHPCDTCRHPDSANLCHQNLHWQSIQHLGNTTDWAGLHHNEERSQAL